MEVRRRILFQDQAHVGAAVDVEMDTGDPARLAGKKEILGIGAPARMDPDPAAAGHRDAVDQDGVQLRPDAGFRLRLPPAQVPVRAAGCGVAGRLAR